MGTGEQLELVPTTIKDANAFCDRHHRHHDPPQGALFAIACALSDEIVGVAIIGRPVSQMLQRGGWTCEVLRLVTNGTRNACSFLYSRARRAAVALGYKRIVTYTLATEDGSSLKASGWKISTLSRGGSWSRKARPRVDHHPTQGKMRWEIDCR